jgi:hypothetical protein
MFKILLNEHNKMSLGNTLLVSKYKANKNEKINNENNNDKHYHFAVCKICFWTATLLRIKLIMNNSNYDSKSISCPVCFDHQSISLIPLMVH